MTSYTWLNYIILEIILCLIGGGEIKLQYAIIVCMKANLEEIKRKAVPILKEAGVTRSSLFGSIVRGEAKKGSDIDMLVEVPRGTGLFGFVGLKHKLEAALKKKVDLGEYSTIKPRLRDDILNSAVPIL